MAHVKRNSKKGPSVRSDDNRGDDYNLQFSIQDMTTWLRVVRGKTDRVVAAQVKYEWHVLKLSFKRRNRDYCMLGETAHPALCCKFFRALSPYGNKTG